MQHSLFSHRIFHTLCPSLNEAIVLAAVQQNGYALVCASAELRSNEAVVLAAVQHDGQALYHASEELRSNEAVVLAISAQALAVARVFSVARAARLSPGWRTLAAESRRLPVSGRSLRLAESCLAGLSEVRSKS